MELSVAQRLILLQLLPPERGYLSVLRAVRDVMRELSFDEEEHARLGMERDGQRVIWDPQKERAKDIEIGPAVAQVVIDRLAELDSKGQLMMELLDICEMFGYDGEESEA